jgi:hypothetical protein
MPAACASSVLSIEVQSDVRLVAPVRSATSLSGGPIGLEFVCGRILHLTSSGGGRTCSSSSSPPLQTLQMAHSLASEPNSQATSVLAVDRASNPLGAASVPHRAVSVCRRDDHHSLADVESRPPGGSPLALVAGSLSTRLETRVERTRKVIGAHTNNDRM